MRISKSAAVGLLLLAISMSGIPIALGCPSLAQVIEHEGVAREYFVWLPGDFQSDETYWLLVVVHGGGGNAATDTRAVDVRRFADEYELSAIVITPEFNTTDKQVSRFPALGESEFLKEVLSDVRSEYKTHPKILLTGYSMGGQFAHRFALSNPDLVQACAPFAAGTWSTPDGRLLIERYGEVPDPEDFLASPLNASKVPERLQQLFDARTASVAGRLAAEEAEQVPFLVMCGTLDPRFDIARDFVSSLQELGFTVDTAWPETPHFSISEEYRLEFEKFSRQAVLFFKKHTESEE